jgi:hypothetical protein
MNRYTKGTNIDLLKPPKKVMKVYKKTDKRGLKKQLMDSLKTLKRRKALVMEELVQKTLRTNSVEPLDLENRVIASIRERIKVLAAQQKLLDLGSAIVKEFDDVFQPIIPPVNCLPSDICCCITLKDASKLITTRSYSTPRKYREAWATLIKQHLEAGRIRPSNLQHASPAFIILKKDEAVLPRWVNDYRALNSNTVMDKYPLLRVDDILADCSKGKIWSVMDMTNSFFQTRMHPDDIHLTAVTTPFGLYEWLVMPMGLQNAPAIHQRWMVSVLRDYIGKICHVYLDNIIVWSNTIEEHTAHLKLILVALRKASLFVNPKKCHFYQLEIDLLSHHISAHGIEANTEKVDKILQWSRP